MSDHDFNRLFSRKLPVLSTEELARKIADAANADLIHDDDHLVEVLMAAGVRPDQVNLDNWSCIKAAAAGMVGARIAAANLHARDAGEIMLAVIGAAVAVAALLAVAPAHAGDGSLISETTGFWTLVAVAVGSFVMAVWPRRRSGTDPYAEPVGHASTLGRKAPRP